MRSRHYLVVVVLVLIGLAGCNTITVRHTSAPDLFDPYRDSITLNSKLSPRTQQTLRRLDLASVFDEDPEKASRELHKLAVQDPYPEYLFALAEMRYLQGRKAEAFHCQDSIGHYYLCAGYAYHYLFATADKPVDGNTNSAQGTKQSLTPRDAFDPRFRLACELYNRGLAKCIGAAQKTGKLDPTSKLDIPASEGTVVRLSVVHRGFLWKPEEFGSLLFCDDLQVEGLDNHYETYGLGVPMIARRADVLVGAVGGRYPRNVCFPASAFFRFEGSLDDLFNHRTGALELYNPLAIQTLEVDGRIVPLQTDLTTPLAYLLSGTELELAGYYGFLRPDKLEREAGVYMLEPYQPGKIPVLMVHGLLSSPQTWAPMFNDLRADPMLRDHYQFWFYFYPTANPYLLTASDLRRNLDDLRTRVDPDHQDKAFEQMVLVGHSMGGLVSHLLTVDSRDDFWHEVSQRPIQTITGPERTVNELRQVFFFNQDPIVKRVIFMGTPHRGSPLSPSVLGQLAKGLIREPRIILQTFKQLGQEGVMKSKAGLPTSVDQLAPDAPILQLLASRPRPEGVTYHSVIGVVQPDQDRVTRWLAGTSCEVGDGVVSYKSAHLDNVASEKVVPADHVHVHQHPLAVLEVRRILLEHLESSRIYLNPPNGKVDPAVIPVGHKEP